MPTKTKRKSKPKSTSGAKRASKPAKKTARPAARAKAKPQKSPKKGPARASRATKAVSAKKPSRSRKVNATPARAPVEKGRLSPRVTAALKAAAWAADWAAAQGRFVWHDLMATDAPAAREFYCGLFGWGVDEIDVGGLPVMLLSNAQRNIGTIVGAPAEVAPHWVPYLAVGDVDDTCQRVGQLGGQLSTAATSVAGLGRFAVATDPQGAAFAALKRPTDAGPPPDSSRPSPGDFCWDELHTADPQAAGAFYADLLGWSLEAVPMEQPYWMASNSGLPVAGLIGQPPDPATRPFWLPYIAVEDVDASAARAVALGGTMLTFPADIPQMGRFAVLSESFGGAVRALPGRGPLSACRYWVRLMLSRNTSFPPVPTPTPNLTDLPEGGVQLSEHWVQPEVFEQLAVPHSPDPPCSLQYAKTDLVLPSAFWKRNVRE